MSNRKTLDGRPSIFRRSTNEMTGESDIQTAERSDAQPLEQPDSQELEQPDSQELGRLDNKAAKTQRIKATFYLDAADIVAIDRMQTEEFTRTGKKPERSHLVSRAIQALAKQQGS